MPFSGKDLDCKTVFMLQVEASVSLSLVKQRHSRTNE